VVTIDPADARDFDDAVSVTRDADTGHWQVTVHIADVGHFTPPGGALDREARRRATSVYLPQRVLPMFPELISNGLASLQEGKLRYVKTVVLDLTPQGQRTAVRFANGAVRVRRRFSYEEVMALYEAHDAASRERERPEKSAPVTCARGSPPPTVAPEVRDMLLRMRELALLLCRRRLKRGALELVMPEAELELDEEGRVAGAHFRTHDVSHQVIEELMLAANE